MMAQSPKVSVLIPAYNQAHYLASAIQSVLAQSYPDYEIVVVDDGSTDNSRQVAQSFGDRIRYIWQENQGLAGARNTGILNARGEFVSLLDSDDLWLPTFLERMVKLAEEKPGADVYYCGWQAMNSNGEILPQGFSGVVPPEKMYQALLRSNFLLNSSVLMQRSSLIQAGLYDVAFRRLQDWEFWLRMLQMGYTFIGIPDRLSRYRIHGRSLSTDPEGGQQAALAIAVKLFGPDDGNFEAWAPDKRRAFGGVYRYHSLSALHRQQNWQAASEHLRKALLLDPALALDVDLFYELALGEQPIGMRGSLRQLHLKRNAEKLEGLLEEVFKPPIPAGLQSVRRQTWGTSAYALAMILYNGGELAMSRRYALAAIRYRPELAASWPVVNLLLKSLVGQSNLERLRRLRGNFSWSRKS